MSSPVRISTNLWQVGGDHLSATGDAAVYLARFGGQAALIDAGCGPGHHRIVSAVEAALPEDTVLSHLFLTHCHYDHCGGADRLRHHFGCRIVAHRKDARFLENGDDRVTAATWYGARMAPLVIDHRIQGASEVFAVGDGELTARFCPGHSPGSCVYLADIDGRRVLFGQDVHGPLHPDLLSNRTEYLASLERMRAMEADVLCEGHFGVIEGRRRVHSFIDRYRREAR
jgi:glyoxylase-like metal-dependent hydrolase (beta-lactamase superfamily II)